ncbi:caspase family protein [Mucilaginibacter flavus]|uniref:caspase family protein n=1 Tax=Mucilaginibacter flavus TaxID=931504 RepID=UPI0025B5835C|nr:caspase family protein [Mucilaginibacter flavus]MDN3583845.1 caspase family protein [Mucilaginibacter flavus]
MPNAGDFAIVVGVDQYLNLKPLNGPVNDANNFVGWLLDPDGGDLPPLNCHLIPNTLDPTCPLQDHIDDALDAIMNAADLVAPRRFYFFFAGHGIGVTWELNGLCLPKWSQTQRRYALSSSSYEDYLVASSTFEEVYFFMDCCRSKEVSVTPSPTKLENILPRGANVSSLVAYATPFENTAGEAPANGVDSSQVQGFFSTALVEGLGGAAADASNRITAKSLLTYCSRRTEELARAQGLNQIVQTKFTDGGRTLETLVLRGTQAPLTVALELTFLQAGNYSLLGPDLLVLQTWEVAAGQQLPSIAITPGIYGLKNNTTNVKQYIPIDGNAANFEFSAN